MKILASNHFSPIRSLKKTAKIAALTLPLMAATESCSPFVFPFAPPPPPPHHHPHHHPHHPPRPHHHPRPYPYFGLFGVSETQDSIQYNDVFEIEKKDFV